MKRSEKIFLVVLGLVVLHILNDEIVSMIVLTAIVAPPAFKLMKIAGDLK